MSESKKKRSVSIKDPNPDQQENLSSGTIKKSSTPTARGSSGSSKSKAASGLHSKPASYRPNPRATPASTTTTQSSRSTTSSRSDLRPPICPPDPNRTPVTSTATTSSIHEAEVLSTDVTEDEEEDEEEESLLIASGRRRQPARGCVSRYKTQKSKATKKMLAREKGKMRFKPIY